MIRNPIALSFVVLGLLSAPLLADIDAAKSYVKEANDLIERNDAEGASKKLELAEAELDGVDAGAKAPVLASIAEAKGKIAGANAAVDKIKYDRELKLLMTDAEESIGNLATWPGVNDKATELFNNPAAKAALGPDLDAAQKKFATFKKLNDKKANAQFAVQAETAVKDVEDKWTEAKKVFADPNSSPGSKSTATDDTQRSIDGGRQQVATLSANSDARKSLTARLDKVATEFTNLALADQVKEKLSQLKEYWERDASDGKGWEDENAAAPTLTEYLHTQSEAMSAFNAPKTKTFISQSGQFLKNRETDDSLKPLASAPEMKAFLDGIQKQHDDAIAKMKARIEPLVAEAEKAQIKDASDISKMKDDIRLALGEELPASVALQARVQKIVDGKDAAAHGAETAKADLITKLRAKATEVWPDLHKDISAGSDIDLSKAGSTITFTSDNLMGYRFKPGDFYFATTLSGAPVAGKIDPDLLKAIKATEAAIGRSIGDDDSDGKWECFAIVTDKKTQLQARKQAESNGTVDGAQVKLTTEYAEPVEATVIEIVAAKCGPFAGAKGGGILQPDATVAKP